MASSRVASKKLNMTNNKLIEDVVDKDVGVNVRVKEEGPEGPREGGGFMIPKNRTRGPQVPQSQSTYIHIYIYRYMCVLTNQIYL